MVLEVDADDGTANRPAGTRRIHFTKDVKNAIDEVCFETGTCNPIYH